MLWKFQAGAGVNAPPSSYTVGGKQYIVVGAGGNTQIDSKRGNNIIAFTVDNATRSRHRRPALRVRTGPVSPAPFLIDERANGTSRIANACTTASRHRLPLLAVARACRAARAGPDDRGKGRSSAPPATARTACRMDKTDPDHLGPAQGYLYLQLRDYQERRPQERADAADRRGLSATT